ncbi:ammonia transport outward protein 2 [Monosporozyma servazzii]
MSQINSDEESINSLFEHDAPTTIHDTDLDSNQEEKEEEEKTSRGSINHTKNKKKDKVPLQQVISNDSLQRIYTSGSNNEYIYIGRQKFLRDDLLGAFGGSLNPGLSVPSSHKFANPAPLGLSGFGLTTFVLSMCNARAQGVEIPNVFVGLAIFYGGFVQLIAGIWEIALENTFGGTALCSFGGFWLSFGSIYIPWFGILDAYKDRPDEFANAMGFFLLGWAIFTYGLCLCTMKSTLMLFSLYFFLALTFLLLSIGQFAQNVKVIKAAGIVGVLVSFIAWYLAYAGLATKHNAYITVHTVPLPTNETTIFNMKQN